MQRSGYLCSRKQGLLFRVRGEGLANLTANGQLQSLPAPQPCADHVTWFTEEPQQESNLLVDCLWRSILSQSRRLVFGHGLLRHIE